MPRRSPTSPPRAGSWPPSLRLPLPPDGTRGAARVAAGDTGRLLSVHGAYLQDWLADPHDDDWRVDAALGGPSRAFADIGSHLVDLVEFVAGDRIVRLNASTRTVYEQRATHVDIATEDLAAVVVELASGAIGTLLVSQVAPGHKNALTVELSGTDASVRFEQEVPEQLWVGRADSSMVIDRDATRLAPDAARLAIVPAGHPMGYQDAFNAFVADAYAAIGGSPPDGLPGFDDGLRAVRVTEAVLGLRGIRLMGRGGRMTDVNETARPGAGALAEAEPVLVAEGLEKSFFGVQVLHGVGLTLRPGEVHGLVGENGAGKSTFMKILAGVYDRDAGSITFGGNEVHFTHPVQAARAGLATVFQEFNLLPERTVAQNVFLGREPRRGGFVDRKAMARETRALLDQLGIEGSTPTPRAHAHRRRAADRRDREGALGRRPGHPDGRADRGARRPRGRAPLRDRATPPGARRRDPLRLAPAEGDLRPLRHHHRAEGRRARLERPGVGARHRRAGATHGRPTDLRVLPRGRGGHRARRHPASSCAAPATAMSTTSTWSSAPARSSASPASRGRVAPSSSRRCSASPRSREARCCSTGGRCA